MCMLYMGNVRGLRRVLRSAQAVCVVFALRVVARCARVVRAVVVVTTRVRQPAVCAFNQRPALIPTHMAVARSLVCMCAHVLRRV